MENKNDIIIPLSKKKTILLVLGALLFFVLGFLFLLVPDFKKSYHPIFLQITGYSGIIFFGICLIFGIKKLFDKNPGLIINANGIVDNSSGVAVGLIPWNMVTFIKTAEIMTTKFILIGVTNAEEIINKQSAFKRFWLRPNYKTYKTPVSINPAVLQIRFDDLEKILIEKWNLYKGQPLNEAKAAEEKQEINIDYKLYTTGWMVAATFIGGPLAGFYLLSVNFKNLKKPQLARKAIIQGMFISLVLFTSFMILPKKILDIIPKTIFPILYSMFLGMYADIQQGSEIKSHIKNGGKKYSGWKAAGIGIVCLVLILLYIFVLGYILSFIFPEKG